MYNQTFVFSVYLPNKSPHTHKTHTLTINNLIYIHTLIRNGILSRIIYNVLSESTKEADKHTEAVKFTMSVLFFSHSSQVPKFNCYGRIASAISALLWGMRAFVCGYVAHIQPQHNSKLSWEEIGGIAIDKIQKGRTINTLSPLISTLRHMYDGRVPIKKCFISNNGDALVNGFHFHQKVWSKIIPTVADMIDGIYQKCVSKTPALKEICNSNNEIVMENWYNLEGYVISNITQQKHRFTTITVTGTCKTFDPDFQILLSLFELAFHGFGNGSSRMTQVTKMTLNQSQFINNCLYYHQTSIKKGSTETRKQTAEEHKLPPSISRRYIIFRKIMGHAKVESNLLLPQLQKRNFDMTSLVTEIFRLHTPVKLGTIRQLWSSLANYLYCDNQKGEMISTPNINKMHHHSNDTHKKWYSTSQTNWREKSYAFWHNQLGEKEMTDFNKSDKSFVPYTNEELTDALNYVVNTNQWKSDFQKNMVQMQCNSMNSSKFFNLHCGAGKFMAALLPLVVARRGGRQKRKVLYISPYSFLLGSQVSKAQMALNKGKEKSDYLVMAYDGTKVTESTIPCELKMESEKELVPDMIFFNVKAAANMLQYHIHQMKALGITDVILDEPQCMLSEYSLRDDFQKLPLLKNLNCSVSLTSATVPIGLIRPLMNYLNLTKNRGEDSGYNIINGGNPVVSGYSLDVVIVKGNGLIDTIMNDAKEDLNKGHSIHYVCKTKKQCNDIAECFRNIHVPHIIVTSESSSKDQAKAAEVWLTGNTRVLISTIITIVGVENTKCKRVKAVGILYNISNLIQLAGRLRPHVSKTDLSLIQFVTKEELNNNFYLSEYKNNDESMCTILDSCGLVSKDNQSSLLKVFGFQHYVQMIKSNVCLRQFCSNCFGYNYEKECMECSVCKQMTRKRNVQEIESHTTSTAPPTTKPTNKYKKKKTIANKSTIASNHNVLKTPSPVVTKNSDKSNTISKKQKITQNTSSHIDNEYKKSNNINTTITDTTIQSTARKYTKPTNPYRKNKQKLQSHSLLSTKKTLFSDPRTQLKKDTIDHNEDSFQENNSTKQRYIRFKNNSTNIITILSILENKCVVCNSMNCDGEDCLRDGCYICGDKHRATVCPYKVTKKKNSKDMLYQSNKARHLRDFLISKRVCVRCLDNRKLGDIHQNGACPVKKRLRRVIIRDYIEKKKVNKWLTFLSFIRTIYASETTFQQYILSIRLNDTNSQECLNTDSDDDEELVYDCEEDQPTINADEISFTPPYARKNTVSGTIYHSDTYWTDGIKTFPCEQLSDADKRCPIVPPDLFHNQHLGNFRPTNSITARQTYRSKMHHPSGKLKKYIVESLL